MKILIGVDESPFSKRAIDFLKSMHWPEGTKVVVFSAAQIPVTVWAEAYGAMVPDATYTEHEVRRHEEFTQATAKDLAAYGFTTESKVVTGDPRVEIIDMAEKEKVDLIVVGSHGRTGLAKLMLGSVASHVVAHAPCSVMVVKGGKA